MDIRKEEAKKRTNCQQITTVRKCEKRNRENWLMIITRARRETILEAIAGWRGSKEWCGRRTTSDQGGQNGAAYKRSPRRTNDELKSQTFI